MSWGCSWIVIVALRTAPELGLEAVVAAPHRPSCTRARRPGISSDDGELLRRPTSVSRKFAPGASFELRPPRSRSCPAARAPVVMNGTSEIERKKITVAMPSVCQRFLDAEPHRCAGTTASSDRPSPGRDAPSSCAPPSSGVSNRATEQRSRAPPSLSRQRTCLKNLPGMPGMNATGRNTAQSVADVAMTGETDFLHGLFRRLDAVPCLCAGGERCSPPPRWHRPQGCRRRATERASSSRSGCNRTCSATPRTVGSTDSGSAIDETSVARQSFRKNQTTMIASSEPSNSMRIESL